MLEVSDVPGGKQMKLKVTIEVKGSEKPALVAESLDPGCAGLEVSAVPRRLDELVR